MSSKKKRGVCGPIAVLLLAGIASAGWYCLHLRNKKLKSEINVLEGKLEETNNRTYATNRQLYSAIKTQEGLDKLVQRADGLYDFDNSLINFENDSLDNIVKSMYLIKTQGVVATINSEVAVDLVGVGTVMLGDYFFTVNHVVDLNSQANVERRLGKKATGLRYVIELDDNKQVELEPVVLNSDADVAVFRLPENSMLNSLEYDLGQTQDLSTGNLVYLVGNSGLRGWNTREGIVSMLNSIEGFPNAKNIFFVSAPINPGDSGSLVVAVRDGQYEVVGFPQGKFYREEAMGFVLGVSQYMGVVLNKLEQTEELRQNHKQLYKLLAKHYKTK